MERRTPTIKINKIEIILAVISLPVLIYFIFNAVSSKKLYKELEYSGINDSAIIIRSFIGAKQKLYYEYKFDVGSKTYNGFLRYSSSNGPVNIGDTFLVKYLERNPNDYNKLLENADFSLIKP